MSTADAKRRVKEHKSAGDALKKRGRYADAAEQYLRARDAIGPRAKLAPWLPVVCALEAACYLKTGAWAAASENLAQKIIELT